MSIVNYMELASPETPVVAQCVTANMQAADKTRYIEETLRSYRPPLLKTLDPPLDCDRIFP
jgi:hypothetical protein